MNTSYRGQTAIVYDQDMTVLGGGQREVFAFCKAFRNLGFNAHVVTSVDPVPDKQKIEGAFGAEFDGIEVQRVPESDLEVYLKSCGACVFLNQSHRRIVRNPAPFGLYRQMFPFYPLRRFNAPTAVDAINSYSLLLSNSSFTKRYTDLRWDFPAGRNLVLLPPLAHQASVNARQYVHRRPAKDKVIISLGRFSPVKRQSAIMSAFLEAQGRGILAADWTLIVIGTRHDDPAAPDYFKKCQEIEGGSKGRIRLLENLPFASVTDHLGRAFSLVHGMGAFSVPGEDPHCCEHFGLGIAEAMAHGCIPLVAARGGIFDILDVSVAGIPYLTYEGLIEGFGEINELWISADLDDLQKSLIRMALGIRFDAFAASLKGILDAYHRS